MDPAVFSAAQPLLDKFSDLADKQLVTDEVQRLLPELAGVMGPKKIISVNITVDVYDEEREAELPLFTTGLAALTGKEPFRTWGDSTPQRYVVEAGIQVVPHDRCPKCWETWDFKLQNPSCPHCGITMGETCQLLLDSDRCPWCDEGEVTAAKPRCDKCGFEVDRKTVVWG